MSRGQQQSVINTAQSQNATNFGNAQSALGDTQSDITDYSNQLAKYVSGNPYTQGGEYSQTVNTGLANASDAGSNSLKGALQSQSMRTGQNSAADAATASSGAQANTRALSSSLASAQQQRIGSEASYNQSALGATTEPISAESGLTSTTGSQANSELGTQESASQTPSFWDEVGQGIAGIPSAAAGNVNYSNGNIGYGNNKGCWVASAVFGGWHEPNTELVRGWVFGTLKAHPVGKYVAKLYLRFGERAAEKMRTSKCIRWALTNLCYFALKQAQKEQGA
jgi:hypothetical protein